MAATAIVFVQAGSAVAAKSVQTSRFAAGVVAAVEVGQREIAVAGAGSVQRRWSAVAAAAAAVVAAGQTDLRSAAVPAVRKVLHYVVVAVAAVLAGRTILSSVALAAAGCSGQIILLQSEFGYCFRHQTVLRQSAAPVLFQTR